MTRTIRIPKAELSGVQGSLLRLAIRKKIGRVPDNVAVMWNHPAVFKDLMRAGARTEKWDRLDANLASFAVMAAAVEIGCGACLDLNYFMAHDRGLAVEKAREVPRWRESTVFTPLERRVMEYAEAVCQTPPTVSDEMSAALLKDLGADGLIEADCEDRFHEPGRPIKRRTRDPFRALRRHLRAGASGEQIGTGGDAVSDEAFVAHRRLLFTVAYEMLGSAVDAEDVLQESWLKWNRADRGDVRDPRAYLVRIVTRTALDRLRTIARRREEYVGPWLPEPLLTSPDVAEDFELADSLSTAMLLVLETLSPTERAVFLLRDVFDLGYAELADAVGKSEPAVRQIAHRARNHVAARRPRKSAYPGGDPLGAGGIPAGARDW